LHIYAIPESAADHAPSDSAQMANYIPVAGHKIGELEFGAGESDLFVGAIEELMNVDFFDLTCGELFGVECEVTDSSSDFGSLDPAEAAGRLAQLTEYLRRPNLGSDATFLQVAEDNAFEPERLLMLMRRFRDLLEAALKQGIPTGVYQ
jgi:hypothetical protein